LVRTAVLFLLASTALAARQTTQSPADVATLLVWMRQALGGDAALAAVTSFTVKGSRAITSGDFSLTDSVELACALPDRFVERSEHLNNLGPLGLSNVSGRHGFNGDDVIVEHLSDDPLPTPTVAHASPPVDAASERLRQLRQAKRAFVRRAFPLFAASLDAEPVTIAAIGQASGPTGPAYAISLKTSDDFTMTAFVDAHTYRVAGLMWTDKPIVNTSGTVTMTMRERVGASGTSITSMSPPAVLPPPPPPATLPDVTWQMVVTDYRAEGGLTWPHRFTTTFGGHKYEDLKLGTFQINPRIDSSIFRVAK